MNIENRELSQKLVDTIEFLKQSISKISVYDLNYYSMTELYYNIAKKINELIEIYHEFGVSISEEIIKQNECLQYLLNDGLNTEVVKKINQMLVDGTMDTIINHNVFNSLNNKIEDYKDELSSQIKETTLQSKQNKNDITAIKSSRYILNVEGSDFDTKFNEALDICKNTGQEIFIPYGEYTTNSTFDINYSANIIMDKGARLNVSQTFLNINRPYCNIELNGEIKLKKSCTVIKLNKPTDIVDKCIIGGNYTLHLVSDDYLSTAIGFHIDSSYWKNTLTIYTTNIGTPIYFTNSWANSNEFYGKLVGFHKAIHFNMTAMIQGNVFKMDFEQVLNHESYGVFLDKNGCSVRANDFFINHWLDNATGRYWCYYDEKYAVGDTEMDVKFVDNRVQGETEGLLKISIESNFMQSLFFTKRDRSIIAGDTAGTHNKPLYTNLYPANIIKSDISKFDSLSDIGFNTLNDYVNCSLVYDEESLGNVICIEYLNSNGGYIYKNLYYNDPSCRGKTLTLSADVKLPKTNVNKKYTIAIQDGVISSSSSANLECNGEWTRIYVAIKVSDTANLVQLNLGRAYPGSTYVPGDKIYIRNIMLNEGYHRNAYYSPSYEENFVNCKSLPTAKEQLTGKVMLLNGENPYICLKNSTGGYEWKRIVVE